MSGEQKVKLFEWTLTNIFLPLVPLGLKIVINIFSNIDINIWDSVELILYSFFINIILINLTSKNERTLGKLFHTFLVVVCVMDIVIMALVYLELGNHLCKIYAGGMSVLTPIIAYNYKKIQLSREG